MVLMCTSIDAVWFAEMKQEMSRGERAPTLDFGIRIHDLRLEFFERGGEAEVYRGISTVANFAPSPRRCRYPQSNSCCTHNSEYSRPIDHYAVFIITLFPTMSVTDETKAAAGSTKEVEKAEAKEKATKVSY